MNKNVLIFGGVALVGVVAYLYFKPKSNANSGATTTGSDATSTGAGTTGGIMPPAGTVFTTPEEVEAITVKISTARDLTKTICDLKKKYNITEDEMNDFMNFTSISTPFMESANATALSMLANAKARKEAVSTIAENINKLKELGYKEEGCKMIKIA
jgi:hypothetical protein